MSFSFPTETVREGTVEVLVPKLKTFVRAAWEYAPSKAPVFYNPAMELNRDIAVCALQAHQRLVKHELIACEPMSGCGVRGIRLAKEVEGIRKIIVNDINPDAARLVESNVDMNDMTDKVAVYNGDANFLLNSYAAPRRRFDYIDVDPFGSPAPYIDSALRALRDGGLLALTATDMAPLCGVHVKACLRKYGGKPMRTDYCHELAVRLLIGCLAMSAAKQGIGVTPMFSYSDYNYVRAYAFANYGAKKADKSVQKMGYILHCFSCFHRESQVELIPSLGRDCPECGLRLQVAGPLWLGSLWDEEFCVMLDSEARRKGVRNKTKILKLLSLIKKEIHAPITYYAIDKLCDRFNLPVPSLSKVTDQLSAKGFQAVPTHFSSKAVRTNAPATGLKETLADLAKFSGSRMQETI